MIESLVYCVSCHDMISAHGNDMANIGMLKICGGSISKPLEIISKSCIEKGQFPN